MGVEELDKCKDPVYFIETYMRHADGTKIILRDVDKQFLRFIEDGGGVLLWLRTRTLSKQYLINLYIEWQKELGDNVKIIQ